MEVHNITYVGDFIGRPYVHTYCTKITTTNKNTDSNKIVIFSSLHYPGHMYSYERTYVRTYVGPSMPCVGYITCTGFHIFLCACTYCCCVQSIQAIRMITDSIFSIYLLAYIEKDRRFFFFLLELSGQLNHIIPFNWH